MTQKMWFVIDRVLCIGFAVFCAKVALLFYKELLEIDVSSAEYFLYGIGISTPLVGKISRTLVDDEDRHKYFVPPCFFASVLADLSFMYRENFYGFMLSSAEVVLGLIAIYFVMYFDRWIRRE